MTRAVKPQGETAQQERSRWYRAMAQARLNWASKHHGQPRRFKIGGAKSAHLSGYNDWIKREASRIFGGQKPKGA